MDTAVLITPELFIILLLTGLVAGFIDSIAGGGGLLTLPMLIMIGLPPHIALGTNKFQGSFGTLSASYNYIKKGEVQLKNCFVGIVLTLLGTVIGSWVIHILEPTIVKHVIPFLLMSVLLYTLFSPKLGFADRKPKMNYNIFFSIFGLLLGFYDGFFGPGTGAFWTAALCIVLGFNMAKAAGYTRVMNFTSNITALSIFIMGNNVLYKVGLIMAVGQMVGARVGSGFAIKKGAEFIRPVFLLVILMMVANLVYNNYV